MSHEIYYTSAPEGMKRGSGGFSTVAATDGIPRGLMDRLETLSAYRHHFGLADGHGGGGENPVSFAHWLLTVTGSTYHVLSRICDSGIDHTHRANAFAHHLVVEAPEMVAGGPAWMLEYPGVMENAWDGRVGNIARSEMLPTAGAGGDVRGGICRRWGAVTGDPGWGGMLADVFVKSPAKPVCILFSPGQDLLPLLEETIALLPAAARWNVTFNTYFTSMPTSATCAWRCCLAGTPASQIGLRYAASGIVIDLTDSSRLGELPEGPYVTFARTGQAPADARGPAAARPAVGSAKPPVVAPPTAPAPDALEEEEEALFDAENEEGAEDNALEPGTHPALENLAAEALPGQGGAGAMGGRRPVLSRPLVRKRVVPIIRDADHLLRTAEGHAAKAAARRRRQIMILFCGALGAIGLGMILVMVALRDNTPAELPPVLRKAATVPAPVETMPPAAPAPEPAAPIPSPSHPTPALPTAVKTNTIIVPSPVAAAPLGNPAAPVVRVVSRFPRVVTLPMMMNQPVSAQGIADYFQTLAIPNNLFDTGARIATMRMHFPRSTDGANDIPPTAGMTQFAYKDGFSGTLLATQGRRLGLPMVSLSWKDGAASWDIAEIALEAAGGRRPAIAVTWKANALMQHPEVMKLAYWLVEGSTLALEGPGGERGEAGQRIAFKSFEPAAFRLTDESTSFLLPAPLPLDATVGPPAAASLPEGWSATWYTDWLESDAALRTAANAWQVIKFRKSTGVAAADAWFLVRFSPGMSVIESTYAKQAAAAAGHIGDSESDLRAITAEIDNAKSANGGILPNTDSSRLLLEKKADTAALVDAYKAAVAGYNDIQSFDIPLGLPDGVRLATLKFQRGK